MSNSNGIRKPNDCRAARLRATATWSTAALCLAASAALSGCSSSTSTKPQVVSIAVTDANGNVQPTLLSSLTVNNAVSLDVTLSNDNSGLGADWTVACGSAPAPGTPLPPGQTVSTACGTFTPVHTFSAPVPNYVSQGAGYVTLYTAPSVPPQGGIVTLYAAATADPSRFASLAFPILGLPVSVGFAPQPPASLSVAGSTPLKAVVSNDYSGMGVTWAAVCGSSACGSFSPLQTASGAATTYIAPPVAPAGGTVTVSATSVTDPTKSISATINIAQVVVAVSPATLSVATDATGFLNATVSNDVTNAGVDWTVSCALPGPCGSVTLHTASGAASTYTAPSAVPAGTVTVTATSTADKTASASAMVTVSLTATPSVTGIVRSGLVPVDGASIALYAAGESGYGSAATLLNDKTPVTTDDHGRFTVTSDTPCPNVDSLLYVVSRLEHASAETGPDLTLLSVLGPCNRIERSEAVVLDESTTITAAYALSAFTRDAAHLGAPASNRSGIANAFATANEIVDIAAGEARAVTPSAGAVVPRAEINTLANALTHCAARVVDTACDGLFLKTLSPIRKNTFDAALRLARGAAQGFIGPDATRLWVELAEGDGPFQPSLTQAREDWTLSLIYPSASFAFGEKNSAEVEATSVDSSGNRWVFNRDGTLAETVGIAAPRLP